MSDKQRTELQNRSMHKWCEMVAVELNRNGVSQKAWFEALKGMDCPNSKDSVKVAFREVLKQVADVESTAHGATKHYPLVYQSLCKVIAEELGITAPAWPNYFNRGKTND